MIKDPILAATLFRAAYNVYVGVDSALSTIAEDLSPEELSACKRAVGKVMGEILFEITEPIIKIHPELLPDTWREADKRNA